MARWNLPIFVFLIISSLVSSSVSPSPGPSTSPYPELPPSPSYPGMPTSPISLPIAYPPNPASRSPAPVSSPPESYTPISDSPDVGAPISAPIAPYPGVKAAYWPSFTGYPVTEIDTSYFTHIYYAFLLPDPSTYKLSITTNDEDMLPQFISTLKIQKPPVTTLLSIGGGGNDPTVFSAMVSSKSNRAIFIQSTIDTARQYGFGGLDLDWEFPANQLDMDNLGVLYKEWRKALNKEAWASGRTRLLLTSAVYFASKRFLSAGESYPSAAIRKYVDWVNPMCFDYHGSWNNDTGPNAGLFDPNSDISTSYGIQSWVGSGVPPNKVVMGLPVYGHTWKLKDPNVHGIGAPTLGVGPSGGTMVYSEVVGFNSANNATVVYDVQSVSMYSYVGDSWIGYDDPTTVTKKVQFAQANGLGGYFFWALGQDKDWAISRQASIAWEQ